MKCTEITYPNGNHDILGKNASVSNYQKVLGFLRKYHGENSELIAHEGYNDDDFSAIMRIRGFPDMSVSIRTVELPPP